MVGHRPSSTCSGSTCLYLGAYIKGILITPQISPSINRVKYQLDVGNAGNVNVVTSMLKTSVKSIRWVYSTSQQAIRREAHL